MVAALGWARMEVEEPLVLGAEVRVLGEQPEDLG